MMNPLNIQYGGDHYKGKAIQPVQYIHANGLGFCEGSVVKYVTRWRDKGGFQDLKKAKHYIELLMELEKVGTSAQPQTVPQDQCPACGAQITGAVCECQKLRRDTSGYKTVADILRYCSWCGSHIPKQADETGCDKCRPEWIFGEQK